MQSFDFFKNINSSVQTPTYIDNHESTNMFKSNNNIHPLQPLQLTNSIATPINKQSELLKEQTKEQTKEEELEKEKYNNVILKNEINFVNYFAPTPNHNPPNIPPLHKPFKLVDNVFLLEPPEQIQYFSEALTQIKLYNSGLLWRNCGLPFTLHNYSRFIKLFDDYLLLNTKCNDINYECNVHLGLIYSSLTIYLLETSMVDNITYNFKEGVLNTAKEYTNKVIESYLKASRICGDRAEPIYYLYLFLEKLSACKEFKDNTDKQMPILYERLKSYDKSHSLKQYYVIDYDAYVISDKEKKNKETNEETNEETTNEVV